MGLSLSILFSAWEEILGYNIFDFIAATKGGRSIRMTPRTSSFKRQDSERTNKVDRSLSFKESDATEAALTVKNKGHIEKAHPITKLTKPTISLLDQPVVFSSPKPKTELDAAATKLQKVYKSYRTRRNLADCAVVVEELWWKTLDSANLRRCSISFFDIEKKETAVSRWARAKTRLAMVGKGLSKDEKAQKLALQHWLEAIDPRHRYGHNLHFYYDIWSESKSTQPFFYWLDVGDGKEVSYEKCTRTDLHRQCIKYLGPKEREEYEVIVEHGKLAYRQTGMQLNTIEGSKWIFVLSTSRTLYVGQKKKGAFQHSSFLSGAAITAAGRLVAHDGVLEAIWPYSGHYLPTEDNFNEFISFLEQHNVDLTNVKRCAIDDDDASSKMVRKDTIPEEEKDLLASKASNNPKTIPVDRPSNATANQLQVVMADITRKPPAFDASKRLSCKWTSGVGPRIGCVRDYPLELQSQALEQVHLSPKLNPGHVISPFPIPSPRPSPKIRVSPRLAYMGLPSPRIQVTSA